MADEKPIGERVSVLESRLDAVDRKFDNNQQLLFKFFDRFDAHIKEEASADTRIQIALTQVADGLEQTNKTLTEIRDQSDITTKSVNGASAAWKTLVTIVSIAAVLISGAWAVYEFSVLHPTQQQETK